MFQKASGYKTQRGPLTLMVESDFAEWRIWLQGPNTVIRGTREFSEEKAKEQALRIAEEYLTEVGEEVSAAPPDWKALEPGEWLNWHA